MFNRFQILMLFCLAGLLNPAVATAFGLQGIDNTSKICAKATHEQERRAGIPRHLLKAVSLAESGRWDKSNRANVAWPWTVTSGGEGRFYDSREEAVAEVEILISEGIQNIDVGCMQINLKYHPDAFQSLNQAFEPNINAAYAAKFLKQKFDQAGGWTKAVGLYHSATPEKGAAYSAKVSRLWREQTQLAVSGNGVDTGADFETGKVLPISYGKSLIDSGRTDKLNAAFRNRMKSKRRVMNVSKGNRISQAARRKLELDNWRNRTDAGIHLAQVAAERKAELVRRNKAKTASLKTGNKDFAERRRIQLLEWRKKRKLNNL